MKFGWGGSGSKFYHKLHPIKAKNLLTRKLEEQWLDCNSWRREPHDYLIEAIELGLLPCKKCFRK